MRGQRRSSRGFQLTTKLTSFLIPWSPGGMSLQKINARTWGYTVVISASLYLIYYSFEIQYSWWAAQPNVADMGLVMQQVIIGIIDFIIIPALLWTPVTSEELMEQVRQAHLVKCFANLRAQHAPQPLGFLLARIVGARDLDSDAGTGQAGRKAGHLRGHQQLYLALLEGGMEPLALERANTSRAVHNVDYTTFNRCGRRSA